MTDTNNNKETFESKTNKVLNIDDTTWFNLPTCKILIKELKQLHDQEIKRISDIGTDFDNDVLFPKLKEKDKEIESIKKLYNLVRENDTKVEIELKKQIKGLEAEIQILRNKDFEIANLKTSLELQTKTIIELEAEIGELKQ